MASKWRRLIWLVPLGFVALIFALAWHLDRDFWRSAPSLMRLAQEAAQRGDYPRALELARKAVSRDPKNTEYRLASGPDLSGRPGNRKQALDLSRQL